MDTAAGGVNALAEALTGFTVGIAVISVVTWIFRDRIMARTIRRRG
jgi:hypothetical protein